MADLDSILARAWSEHHQDRPGMAELLASGEPLVMDASGAARWAPAVGHVVGEECGDWSRARELLARVATRLPPSPELVPVWVQAAVAATLSGSPTTAAVFELRAAGLTPADSAAVLLRVRLGLVAALGAARRWDEALPLHEAALGLFAAIGASSADRAMAVTSNNFASALLDLPERTPDQDLAMERAAEAAHTAWCRAGNWLNEERADYLRAKVANARGQPERALEHAARALATIGGNGAEPVDAAFLEVERACACKALGRAAEQQQALAAVAELARSPEFADAGLRDWLDRELARVR